MSSDQVQMTASRGVDEVLKESELGSFIAKNKVAFISLVVLILIGVLGWGVYTTKQKSSDDVLAVKVYKFSSTTYNQWIEDKIKTPEMMKAYQSLKSEVSSFSGMFPFSLELSDQLLSKGLFNEAKTVLTELKPNNDLQTYFQAFRLSVVYEELGEIDSAIKTLEATLNLNVKLMESRVYLDLGRFYLKSGNKDKAQVNLDHVISKFGSSEESKIAKLYLSKIK